MSTNPAQRTIPQFGLNQNGPTHEEVMNKLNFNKSNIVKSYYENVSWVQEQVTEENITPEQLRDLVISSSKLSTHQSPITQELNSLYQDNNWAKIVEGVDIKLPALYVHLAADKLTREELTMQDFPKVCHTISPALV